jgi:hypothetical protein
MGNVQLRSRKVNITSNTIPELISVVIDHDHVDSAVSSTACSPSSSPVSSLRGRPSVSSSAKTSRRKVSWVDDTACKHVAKAATFHSQDASFILSRVENPLDDIVGKATAEPILNARLPVSNAEMLDKLAVKHIQLESMLIRFNTAFVFVDFLSTFSSRYLFVSYLDLFDV